MYSIAYGKAMPIFSKKRVLIHYYRKWLYIPVLIVLLSLPVSLAAQNPQNISVSFKNAPLGKVIREIEQQSGYRFFYNETLVGKAKLVTIEAKNAPLEKVLEQCFQDQSFTYSIVPPTVVIKEKKAAPDNISPRSLLSFSVSGTVTDQRGKAIEGAMILQKGTSTAVISDASGGFKIKVSNEKAILVVSCVGYLVLELPVEKNALFAARLQEVPRDLDDVIVIGYGTQKKSDATGSIASIKSEDLEKSRAVSFMEAMQGRLAGVQITSSSGEPGAAISMSIRGANSFSSGTQPLYVIDGVQVDVNTNEVSTSGYGSTSLGNPLAGINPSDILSIEVLKDASATAIFGSRGANGVVIVTTKSGKLNTSSLEFSSATGIAKAAKHINMLGAQDYATYRFVTTPTDPLWGKDTNGDGILDSVKNMSGQQSYDWQKLLLRSALSQNYNLNYSGGSNKTTFAISAGYLNQQGLVDKNKYERYSLNLKVSHKATDRLKLGTTVNLSNAISTGTASNGGNGPRNYNGLIQTFLLYKPVNVPGEGDIASDPDNSGLGSPIDFVKYSYKQTPITRMLADLFAEYRIMPGLALNVSAGGVLTNSKNREWYPSTTSWGLGANGVAILTNSNTTNWYQTSTLTYTKKIGEHQLTALAGLESNSYQYEGFGMRGEGFDIQSINAVDNIATAKVIAQRPTTEKYKYNRLSQFGRLNYTFLKKYLLTLTLRNDASSKFGEGNKAALFPSGAIAWKAINESFCRKMLFLSDLKFRGSYGVTGNDRIPAYRSLSETDNVYYANSGGTASLGIAPASAANPGLKWETTYQYDAGVDIGLFKDRVLLTVDAYLKQTRDLLINADIAGQGGFIKQWQNVGRVDNKGIEFSINTTNVNNKKFGWTTNLNISFNRNKIQSLGNVSYLPVNITGGVITSVGRLITGQPIGTGYGYVFDGIYQLSDFTKQSTGIYTLNPGVVSMQSRSVQPGDFKYKDLSGGDNIVDNVNDVRAISNSNPKHYGGFVNNFRYGNFEMNILLQWSYGNDLLNMGRYRLEAGAAYYANVTQEYWDGRWTTSNPSNQYASLAGRGKTEMSSYYVEDGSYLRIKNITLAYSLPLKSTNKSGIKGCRFYITGENLYTLTSYSGFDPEIASYSPLLPGIDNISYPRARTFTAGINLKF
jgi:TonB-linked SusC/RagA family outer membrane protein